MGVVRQEVQEPGRAAARSCDDEDHPWVSGHTELHRAGYGPATRRFSSVSHEGPGPHNPAVRELLDHVAEELAKEYISLMKETAAKPKERKES